MTQDLEFWTKQVYLQYNSIAVDMKRNQRYQSFNEYNVSRSDWNWKFINYPKGLKSLNYSKKCIKRSENAPVTGCMYVLVTIWLKVDLDMHYKCVFRSQYQIKGQWSMIYTVP